MAEDDRERWDAIYREGGHVDPQPARTGSPRSTSSCRARAARSTSRRARAGSRCFWAARGLATLAVDVSPEGLRRAREAAARAGLALETRALDLEREPLPDGPFAAISCFHYLQRDLFPALAARLAPGGVLACEIATRAEPGAEPEAERALPARAERAPAAVRSARDRRTTARAGTASAALARVLARRPSPPGTSVTSSSYTEEDP